MDCNAHEDRTLVKRSEFYGFEKTNTLVVPEHEVRLVLDDMCAEIELQFGEQPLSMRNLVSKPFIAWRTKPNITLPQPCDDRWRDGMGRMKRGAKVEKDFNSLEEVIDDIFSDPMTNEEMLELEDVMNALSVTDWTHKDEDISDEDLVFQGQSEINWHWTECEVKVAYEKQRDSDALLQFMDSLSGSMNSSDVHECLECHDNRHVKTTLKIMNDRCFEIFVNEDHTDAMMTLGAKRTKDSYPEVDEIEMVRDYVVNNRHLKKHKYEDDIVALEDFLKELDAEHDDDLNGLVFQGQSLNEALDATGPILSFLDTTNIVVCTIQEIYDVIYDITTGKPKKLYKVYTKLSILCRVLTGCALTEVVYTNFMHSLVRAFLSKWLHIDDDFSDVTDYVQSEDEFEKCASNFDELVSRVEARKRNQEIENKFQGQSMEEFARFTNNRVKDGLSIFESDFGQKLVTFCSLLICVPFVNKMGITPEKFGADKMTEYLYRKSYAKQGLSVPLVLLETSTSIFLKITEVIRLGPTALLVTQEDHVKVETYYAWLKRNHMNFACRTEVLDEHGNPDAFTLETYAHKCCVAIEILDKMIPTLKKHPYAMMRAERQKAEISNFQNDCYAELRANVERDQPYGLMLVGQPSIGKSALQDISLRVLHDADNATGRFGIKYSPELKYSYPPNDNFYSGFSSSHTSLVIDDVAQKRADIMIALGGDDIVDLIRIVNTMPFTPEQAELHKKGKVPMRCRYVMGTTNTEHLNAEYIFENPAAIYRRFYFVRCSVKRDFREEPGGGLKGDDSNPSNVDMWNFTVIKHFPIHKNTIKKYFNPKKSKETGVLTWDRDESSDTVFGMSDYCNFLRNSLEAHWVSQDKSTRVSDVLDRDVKCDCGISRVLCGGKCWKAQGLFEMSIRYFAGRWTITDYILAALCLAFFPSWALSLFTLLIYTFMPRTLSPSNFFPNLMTAVQGIMLPLVIIPCLCHNTLMEHVRPTVGTTSTTKPRWSVRCATYLIPKLPKRSSLRETFSFLKPLQKRWGWARIAPVNAVCAEYYMDWLEETMMNSPKEAYNFFRQHVLTDWKFQSAIIFIVVVKLAIKFLRTKERFEGQAGQSKMPVPDEFELKSRNTWLQQNHIGDYPAVGRTISQYDLRNRTMLGTVLLKIHTDKGITRTNGFLVKSNVVVTPAHFMFGANINEVDMLRLHKNGQYGTINIKCDKTNHWVDIAKDLLYIQSNKIVPAKDMYEFFLSSKEPVHVNAPGYMTYIDPEDQIHKEIKISRISDNTKANSFMFNDHEFKLSKSVLSICDRPTKVGLCGAPVIVEQGIEKYIVGIHCAGVSNLNSGNNYAVATCLFREDIDAAILNLGGFVMPGDADDDIAYSLNGEAMRINTVHPKCVTNRLHGEFHVIGGTALPRSRPRTNVQNTPICEDVVAYYKKNTHIKAITHTSPITCDEKEAALIALEPAVQNSYFYPGEIKFAVQCLTWELLRTLSAERLGRIKPVPWSVAVNGRDGIPYLDRIKLQTSAGYGHPGPKKKFFFLLPPTLEHAVNYAMTPELTTEVEYIMNQYNKGEEANPVFKCSFKDEPITFEKAEKNKVRVFSGSPVAFSIVARRYYLSFIRECVGRHRLDFEMAIGANAHGVDWERIYNHVVKHGAYRCFAGDYKAFDKQMSPEIIIAAFTVILNIFEASGWSEEDLRVARGIATDTAFPTSDVFGTLVQLYGANPSGHILTTPINSLVNSLYFRMAVGRILNANGYTLYTELDPLVGLEEKFAVNMTRFNDIISLVTYGDDNCGSISNLYPCLHHTSIQNALKEAGITYTMDRKDADSVQYVHVSEITFLKRHFVVQQSGRVYGPLLEESIFKSLTVWTKSKSITPKEQLACVISSVNREYFFYGQRTFERRRNFLVELLIRYDLMDYLPGGRLEEYHEIYDSLDWATPAP